MAIQSVQYAGYCYDSTETAARAASSGASFASADSVLTPSGVDTFNNVNLTAVLNFKSYGISTNNFKNVQVTQNYQACTEVGPMHNQSGVTLNDALTVSWLVVLVWAAAYYFKMMRIDARGY